MGYTVNIEHFEGPLDLLLQLVEKDELEISKLSLASVAEQFIKYMQSKTVLPEEMADFLVVASKLVYYKSKLLLPGFSDQEMEEGPDLESQLRQYQMFVAAAKQIDQIWKSDHQSFSRSQTVVRRIREVKFAPPENASLDIMLEMMKRIIARIEPIVRLPKVAIRKAISLHERIKDLFSRIHAHATISFKTYIRDIKHREDAIVSFLALLELVKQQFVMVEQIDLFNDISISAHPEAPERDPLAESYA